MNWTVADVMTSPVITVSELAGFRHIVATLCDHGVSGLPVIDADGKVIGVVSESDLILRQEYPDRAVNTSWAGMLAELNGQAAAGMVTSLRKAQGSVARELMSSPAVITDRGASLGEAARLMHRRHVKRLVVVDGASKPIGMVTRSDLLKVFLDPADPKAPAKRRALLVGAGWPYEPGPDVDEDVPLD
jgi:CBS domain-containing protein